MARLPVGFKKYTKSVAAFECALPPVAAEGEERSKRSPSKKEMIMKLSTIAKTFTIAAVATLALGMAPTAEAETKGCSNATLKGSFSHRGSGFVIAQAGAAAPFAGVGTDTFDGNGRMTGTATVSINGNIVPANETGTYKVNSDCTGTYTVAFSGGGTTTVYFVITDGGNEIQGTCIDPGIVITHIFRKRFPEAD